MLRVEVTHVQRSEPVVVTLIEPGGAISVFHTDVSDNAIVLEVPAPATGVWEIGVNSAGQGFAPFTVTTSLVVGRRSAGAQRPIT